MTRFPDPPGPVRRVSLGLTVGVGLLTSLVAMESGGGRWKRRPFADVLPPSSITPATSTPAVRRITLVHDEPDLPPGPNREIFEANCNACHSPRLVANQPPFPREVWAEEVHKMVAAYGAFIAPEAEPRIVDYLMSYRGR